MARPIKEGLEYFPLDVDMDQDDKIALIEAKHGLVGFAVIIKLLMKIYKHNYYYEWTEKEQLLFSKRVNVDINSINVIINDCIKWGLFNAEMLETYQILTSRGIQRRYLEAIGRRQKVKIIKEYLLLDNNDINVYKNLVIVNINTTNKGVNVDINTQSKVKESKVKESKERENNDLCMQKLLNKKTNINTSTNANSLSLSPNEFNNDVIELCNYYEQLKPGESIAAHIPKLQILINDYGIEWVKEALERTIKNKNKFIISYLEGILRNWKLEGKEESDRDGPNNGNNQSNNRNDEIEYDFSKYGG